MDKYEKVVLLSIVIIIVACFFVVVPKVSVHNNNNITTTVSISNQTSENDSNDSDLESRKLNQKIETYLKGPYHSDINKDEKLYNIALQNAVNGNHSIKLVSDNSENAYLVFQLSERSARESIYWGTNPSADKFGLYGRSVYNIATYRNEKLGMYNVSVVFNTTPSVQLVTNKDGSYSSMQPSSYIEYLWE